RESEEGAPPLPAALVAGRGRAPAVSREPRAGRSDELGHFAQRRGVDARLRGGELEGVRGVDVVEQLLEHLEVARPLGMHRGEILHPVPPAAHELAVVAAGAYVVGWRC